MTTKPTFDLKSAAKAYGVPLHELRQALDKRELKMELVPVMDYRLTGEALEAWLTTRAEKTAAEGR